MDNGKNINITITAGTVMKTLLIIFLFLLLLEMRDLVLVVLTAVVLASAVEPVTKWLERRKIKRVPAVILVYLGLALVTVALMFFFVPTLLEEFSSYISNLPKYLSYVQVWFPVNSTGVLNATQKLQALTTTSFSLQQTVTNLSHTLSSASEGFVQTVSVVFGGVISFVLVVVLSFYLAVQEDGVANFLRIITPAHHEHYVIDLWKRSQRKIGLWMQGQLLLGVTVGMLVYLVLSILGLKHALLLALLAAIFEIIPVFGPILSAIPGILVAITERGSIGFGIAVMCAYIIIQQFENHLFYPLVVKKIVGVSPIVVILALVIGANLAGFLGVIISVPLSATLMEFLSDVEKGKFSSKKIA